MRRHLSTALMLLGAIVAATPARGQCLLGTVQFGEYVYDISIVGTTAYVPLGERGVRIYDLSDPATPSLIGSVAIPAGGNAIRAVAIGQTLCVVDSNFGVRLVDISDLSTPVQQGAVALEGDTAELVIEGSRGYVIHDELDYLSIVDFSDTQNPQLLSTTFLERNGYSYHIVVQDETVFVPDHFRIHVVEASNPISPQLYHTPNLDTRLHGLFVQDNVAYAAGGSFVGRTGNWGLYVYDVTDIESVKQLGSFPTSSRAWRVVAQGDRAYLSDSWYGLLIFDVSDLSRPQLIDIMRTPTNVEGVSIFEGRAYVGGYGTEMYIFDVSGDCQSCRADVNQDGVLTSADFSAWVAGFNAHSPGCDQNLDTYCTPADFTAWIANFNRGCDF